MLIIVFFFFFTQVQQQKNLVSKLLATIDLQKQTQLKSEVRQSSAGTRPDSQIEWYLPHFMHSSPHLTYSLQTAAHFLEGDVGGGVQDQIFDLHEELWKSIEWRVFLQLWMLLITKFNIGLFSQMIQLQDCWNFAWCWPP